LRRWLQDADPRFEYTEDRTYPAGRFFETRKGDCFSFTNIFIALARALDVDAHYVFVRDVSMTREQGGGYIDTSHIAAEYGTGPRPEVVDYFRYPDERTLPEFRPLTDLEAAALFNSNLAVGQMMRGRAELAEEILAFLVARAPALPELRNNLAVAMISQNRVAEARDVLQAALVRFPTYAPLYTNALTVATAQGDENMAQSLESWGESVAEDDPLFVFGQGMRRFRRHDFSGAVERFQRVTRLQDQSAIAWAWLSRAENAAGKAEDSTQASRRALSLGSSDPRIQAILAPMSARSPSSK
jgi:tetratricopeptide (TPR) repeat protein